ncbi:MAG TPA: hypothetical protein VFM18_06800, partial [Methanosarcina sp.]|nr:hypothetical protein [Methanosarcina sp.]
AITSMSRTGASLTCNTAQPHGIPNSSPFPNIYLKSNVTIPGLDSSLEFSIKRTSTYGRTIYKKTGNNGAITSAGTFTVTLNSASYLITLLTAVDPVSGKIYYIEANSRYIYVINSDGTYNTAYDAGMLIDQAAFDKISRSIKLIGRPISSSDDFDYTNPSSNYYCSEFSTETNTSPYIMLGEPLRTTGAVAGEVYAKPEGMSKYNKLGLWRANNNSPLYWCLAMLGKGQVAQVALSNNRGLNWSYLFTTPNTPPSNVEIVATTISAGNLTYRASSQELYFSFANHTTYLYNLYSVNKLGEFYWIINDGAGNPTLKKSSKVLSSTGQSSSTSSPDWETNLVCAMKSNDKNGKFVSVYKVYNTGTATYDYNIMWMDPDWEPAYNNTPVIPVTPTGNKSVTIQDSVFTTVDGFLITFEDGVQYLAEYASATLIGTITEWASAVGTKGITANAAAIVTSGIYTVTSVPSTTQLTFTSIQSPQVDFGNTTVNVKAAFTEISYTDTVDPGFLGPYLYSSPAVEGSLQTNFPPPLCRDTTLFRTTAFYANITQNTTVQITMLKLPVAGQRVY